MKKYPECRYCRGDIVHKPLLVLKIAVDGQEELYFHGERCRDQHLHQLAAAFSYQTKLHIGGFKGGGKSQPLGVI